MPRPLTPADLFRFQLPGDPQISPDGRRIAFTVSRLIPEQNEARTQIWLVDAAGEDPAIPFTNGKASDRAPRWSPDGQYLAFLSNRSGKTQLWVMPTGGGEAKQLTTFKDGIASPPVWSPDGKCLFFTAEVGPEGPGTEGKEDEEKDPYKKYTKDVLRIDRLHYKTDGVGLHDPTKREQVFMIDREGGEPVQITRGHWNHDGPVPSPDGRFLLVHANRRADDDRTPFHKGLWRIDLTDLAAEPVQLPGPNAAHGATWSPDGQWIAFHGYDWAPYHGYVNNKLWVTASDGSGYREVAPKFDRPVGSETLTDMPAPASSGLRWTPDGQAILSLVADEGRQYVARFDLATGEVTPLTPGDHVVTSWSADATTNRIALGLTRPDLPADLFLVEGGEFRRLTEWNRAFLDEVELAPVEHFRFATAPGTNAYLDRLRAGSPAADLAPPAHLAETDGWLMRPVGWKEGKRSPAILEVHGGPMAQYGWTFFFEFQLLAAAGYAVIYTNPRGSQGYGQDFCACIEADWGNLDYLDVMAGLDAALAANPWIDPARLGITGGSYGGFMTNWAIGQTDRFKAAVTGRSCVNEYSMVGTSDFGFIDMATYPNPPWESAEFYRGISPLTHVAKIKTPLLIEHQEQDLRCPIEQAEQLYVALKVLGQTVEMIRYPGESHGMSRTGKPWHRVHRLEAILDWFRRYNPAE
jgi:dipeptidyl aminopeptidase/acylaminoacyl peptidase